MKRISLIETAHAIVGRHLSNGSLALDATLGNGHDTLFLAQCVGAEGHVFGFDIQSKALLSTRLRLQASGLENRTSLFQASHADMLSLVPESVKGKVHAVMFNLGYLPGGDKTVMTQSASTLAALDAACSLLADQGIISVLAYPGHVGGDLETQGLADWCRQLECLQQYQPEIRYSDPHQAAAPQLFVIRKRVSLL